MSSETETVTIEGGASPASPTIEESHAALVKEGIISDDENSLGANTDVTPDSEASDEGKANEDAPKSLDKFRDKDGNIDYAKLEKSYLELESKASGKPDDNSEDNTEENSDDTKSETENKMEVVKEPTKEETEKVKEIAEKADVNLAEMSQEWLANGELAEADYDKLEKAGYPREMVDTFARGLTADVSDISNSAMEVAGGSKEYGEMIDWASENLSEAEIAAFDKAVSSKDKATVLQAVRGLNAQYKIANDDGTQEPTDSLQVNLLHLVLPISILMTIWLT